MIATIRGCLAVLFIVTNLIISATVILIAASIAYLLPGRAHYYAMKLALKLPVYWMIINKYILKFSTFGKWDVKGQGQLDRNGWYVLIANHQSWIDIPVLGSLFSNKIPILKFFMKKELLWQLPIAGIDCYLLGYPILSRHSRKDILKNPALKNKDIEATKQACQKFKVYPTTFINFIEGTRFSQAKHRRQRSPYQYLLKPKATGMAIVLSEMANKLNGIINVTIYYQSKNNSLWHFLCGKIDKIHIRYDVIAITDDLVGNYHQDRHYRKHFQQWLNKIWHQKDQIIATINKNNE